MSEPIRFGANLWNQYTDWPSWRHAAVEADRLGYDTLWTWDHLYPIVGSDDGPMFEAWTSISAWAALTQRVRIGLMVGANTFRNPALVAKMATTLDHISNGRVILGIGGAWFETEHRAFGLEFGTSPGERLRWLEEAAKIMRGMLHGEEPSGERYYAVRSVRNDPPPVQARLPLLIGGGGEKRTLRIVARYADACNFGGGLEAVKHKDVILRRHCAEVGRDEAEIERTTGAGIPLIRDDATVAQRTFLHLFEVNGGARPWNDQLVGTPEQIAAALRPFLEIGFRHLVFNFPAPVDLESLERLIREVKPMLEAAG